MNSNNQNNNQKINNNNAQNKKPNRNPFLNRNRQRFRQNRRFRNRGRKINKANRFSNQNVIKYNKPKNVIQKNYNKNNKNSSIRGKDLVIPTNDQLVNQDSGVYAIIPINPLYWQGTRIKNMASQYQYYVPKTLSIEYVPTVSKFQQGTVTIGCISNQIINQGNIQQALISSTSGESFSCSEFFVKNIALSSLLQQKKLLLNPDVNKETVPFYIVILLSGVLSQGNLIAPGSVYINYNFEFYNPITETLIYKTENSIKIRDIDFQQQNINAVLLEQNGEFGVGTKIDIEIRNGIPVYKYNNSDIQLNFEKYVTAFYSSTPEALRQIVKFDLTDFTYNKSDISVSLSQGESLLIVDDQEENFICYIRITSSSITIESGKYYKILNQTPEIITNLQNAPFTLSQFGTSSSNALLKGYFVQTVFVNQHD